MREFPRIGEAIVQVRGRTYVGHVTIGDGLVHLVGHRRERPWHTTTGPAETRYPVSRTWPIGRIDHIDWADDPKDAAA